MIKLASTKPISDYQRHRPPCKHCGEPFVGTPTQLYCAKSGCRKVAKQAYRERLKEADIAKTCSHYLALDAWRQVITDPPRLRGLGVTEKGIADGLYVRYCPDIVGRKTVDQLIDDMNLPNASCAQAITEVLWVEWKRKGGVAAAHQIAWHRTERARGALTLIAGVDFEASIDGFLAFYKQSGLNRRL